MTREGRGAQTPRDRPGAALAWGLCAATVVLWGAIRLGVFRDMVMPLSYTVPLLITLWTRDKRMLWGMSGLFLVFAALKTWWIFPGPALPRWADWATFLAQLVSIVVAAAIIHAVLDLRLRLERRQQDLAAANAELEARNEELKAREEEIEQQNEELAGQNEELRAQGEELEQQSEELNNQSEELQASNDELARREELLQAILSTRYALAGEADALVRICRDGLELIGGGLGGALVAEALPDGLRVAAAVGISSAVSPGSPLPLDRSLAGLVVREARTASLDELSLRPDLVFAVPASGGSFRSVLAAPLVVRGRAFGAVEFYSSEPGPWTEDQFRLAEWVALLSGVVLQRMLDERALHDTLQRQRVSLDAAQLGAWTYTFASNLWELDERARIHYGIDVPATTHDEPTMLRIMPDPADRAAMWQAVAQACDPAGDGHYEMRYRIAKADGRTRWISAWGQVEFAGTGPARRATRMIGASRDVTDEREAQEQLEASERRLRQMADAIPQLAWIARPDGWIHWYNQRWYEYTGTTLEQMEGWGWQSVHDPEVVASVVEQYRRSIATGEPFDMTFPLRGADGAFRRFLTRMRPLKDAEGRVRQWFGTNTDVEELKRVQEELSAARLGVERASLAKDQFLAMLSHELRTPLNPALMAATLLEQHVQLPHELRQAAGIIRRNVELEARLIDDLLDLTRVARGKLTLARRVLDGLEAVRHAIRTCEPELTGAGLQLSLHLPDEPVLVDADPARLQQIVWNLLQNAIKFTPAGGRIVVTARAGTDGGLRVEVCDTGRGIEREALERIFDPFEQGGDAVTLRYGGLGLGLSICRGLVALHEGTITAQSEGPGRGATFVVTLPPANERPSDAAPGELASHDNPTQTERGRSRILLVDDHADTAVVTAALLESLGHHVTTADCVRDALAKFEQHAFDLLVSDLGLPDGSGFDLLRSLSSRRPIKAIALSGYGMDADVRRSLQAGFAEHLTKPINVELLQTAVRRVLGPLAS